MLTVIVKHLLRQFLWQALIPTFVLVQTSIPLLKRLTDRKIIVRLIVALLVVEFDISMIDLFAFYQADYDNV
jgi:hypothetical protein